MNGYMVTLSVTREIEETYYIDAESSKAAVQAVIVDSRGDLEDELYVDVVKEPTLVRIAEVGRVGV